MPVKQRIAYVVSRFPVITETFVVREMDALTKLGVGIDLYALVAERPDVVSEASARWAPYVHTRPWVSPAVLRSNLRVARRNPRWAATS